MATLKLQTDTGNHIWLMNVKRVQTLYYFQPEEDPKVKKDPWTYVNEQIDNIGDLSLKELVKQKVIDSYNYSAIGDKYDYYIVLANVEYNDENRLSENWLVIQNQNFIMENGKTIDRI